MCVHYIWWPCHALSGLAGGWLLGLAGCCEWCTGPPALPAHADAAWIYTPTYLAPTTVSQSNDWYRGLTELVQHSAYRGSSHPRKGGASHVIFFYPYKDYLRSRRLKEGWGSQHPVDCLSLDFDIHAGVVVYLSLVSRQACTAGNPPPPALWAWMTVVFRDYTIQHMQYNLQCKHCQTAGFPG